jgi:hypothetical protein
MAKNEIKMLLLGAGESGKVHSTHFNVHTSLLSACFAATVDSAQTDEIDSPRRI